MSSAPATLTPAELVRDLETVCETVSSLPPDAVITFESKGTQMKVGSGPYSCGVSYLRVMADGREVARFVTSCWKSVFKLGLWEQEETAEEKE